MLPPVAILAGGLSTRMYPVTKTVPKALLDVAGEPFIDHQLKLLASKGVSKVVLCVGNLGEQIKEYVGDGKRFGLSVEYSFDGEKLLGTGGAIKRAIPKLGKEFFIMYGDSYLNIDLKAVYDEFRSSGKKAVMTVYRNDGKWDLSNVIFRDGAVVRYDKDGKDPEMIYIDFGLAIIKRESFDILGDGQVADLSDIYKSLVSEGQMAGMEVHERFYEIGSFAGLKELNELLGGK